MGRAVLEVRDLWVGDGPSAAVRGVNFAVGPGEILGVLGGPEAGKSRLLRCVGLDYPPTRGDVLLRGEEVSGATSEVRRQVRARRIELVHPPAPQGEPDPTVARGHKSVLLPITRAATVPVAGMRQRIQMAKALTNATEVLLLDEPFAGVDPAVSGRIRELLRRLRAEIGTAVVLATRDASVCYELADEIVMLDHGAVADRSVVRRDPPSADKRRSA